MRLGALGKNFRIFPDIEPASFHAARRFSFALARIVLREIDYSPSPKRPQSTKFMRKTQVERLVTPT